MEKLNLIKEGIVIAARSLKSHGGRSFLTALGIAIGIFCITIIFTVVSSLSAFLSQSLNELGPTTLFVSKIPWSSEEWEDWPKIMERPPVSYRDFQKLERELNDIEGICYSVAFRGGTIRFENASITSVGVSAITPEYYWMNNFKFDKGRPFSELENSSGRPVCILGAQVAEKLFGKLNPIGRQVRIRGKKITVVGVLALVGGATMGRSMDDQCFLPYHYASRIYRLDGKFQDSMVMARAQTEEGLPAMENNLIGLMRASRGLAPRDESNFSINSPTMILNMVGNVMGYVAIGGVLISIFSVIVGGFGIGNIMFATVKERTFEIGLQKALGATKWFVRFQFLMESIFLCLLGGTVGLILNFLVSLALKLLLAAQGAEFKIVISAGNILTGVLLSVFIGLVAGFIPSMIASRMDPVESMRA